MIRASLLALAALSGCTGPAAVPCAASFVPDPWDPVLEDEVRADEATEGWVATGEAVVDPAATEGCAEAPCLSLSGLGGAVLALELNRGETYRLGGTVSSDVSAVLTVTQSGKLDAPTQLVEVPIEAGVTTLDEELLVSATGKTIELTLTLAETGNVTLDDLVLTGTRWAPSDAAPAAPVRLGFLIHVEENGNFVLDEAFWRRRAAVLEGVSATLAAHGAGLGMQLDASFVRGATQFDAEWVADRSAEGAGWSVHIHDEESAEDAEQAFRDGKVAHREAGVGVSDLNGGFGLARWSTAASAGFTSLTAYKDPSTQGGLPHVQVQPWLVADGAGTDDPDGFLEHDPNGPLLYIPGHDVREVVHARFPESAGQVLSQVLAHAREGQVNTWYFVLHVDGFGPDDEGELFDAWLSEGGLEADLAHYDAFLTDIADPLVDDGLLVYDTPGGMRAAWDTWNTGCAAVAE